MVTLQTLAGIQRLLPPPPTLSHFILIKEELWYGLEDRYTQHRVTFSDAQREEVKTSGIKEKS